MKVKDKNERTDERKRKALKRLRKEVEARNFVSSVKKKEKKEVKIGRQLKAESAHPEAISDTDL